MTGHARQIAIPLSIAGNVLLLGCVVWLLATRFSSDPPAAAQDKPPKLAAAPEKFEADKSTQDEIKVQTSPGLTFDALLLRRDGTESKTFLASVREPQHRAQALREAFKDARTGDKVLIGPGLFDFGHDHGNVIFPDEVTLQGSGMTATHLLGSVWSDVQGTQFVLQNTTVTDMTLECRTYKAHEDGRTVGFDVIEGQKTPFDARISRCKLIGNAWTVYNWTVIGNHLRVEDSEIVHGRIGVAACTSGGSFQEFDIVRCKFMGDASLSDDIGHTSNVNHGGVVGVMALGGTVRVIDCEMHLVGRPSKSPSWTPRVCGITDNFHKPGSPHTKIEVMNLRCTAVANGAPAGRCWDLDIQVPEVAKNLRLSGGWGSAPDGGLRKNF